MRLGGDLDAAALKQAYAEHRRLQIDNFLVEEDAQVLARELQTLDWRLVLNEGPKHFDISSQQMEALGPVKLDTLCEAATERAEHEFQYLFKNYPVADIAEGSGLSNQTVIDALAFMNSATVLELLNEVTGHHAEFCDMQATVYERGHFLTTHDDNVDGKNRQFAYVLNLSENWKAGWGGLLKFLSARATVSQSFTPRFNSLSIFSVPTDHRVSKVEPHARSNRLSLTGWYRTR